MVEVMVSLLDEMVRREASDLHLTSGAPSFLRVAGRFYALPGVSSKELAAWLDARGDVCARLGEMFERASRRCALAWISRSRTRGGGCAGTRISCEEGWL